jgi:hypothetical protein
MKTILAIDGSSFIKAAVKALAKMAWASKSEESEKHLRFLWIPVSQYWRNPSIAGYLL